MNKVNLDAAPILKIVSNSITVLPNSRAASFHQLLAAAAEVPLTRASSRGVRRDCRCFQLSDWDPRIEDSELNPTCIHYSIEVAAQE
jgi:hypothetical protein